MEFDKDGEGNIEETEDRLMPKAAVKIAATHLDRIITGLDDGLVSTISNGTLAGRRLTSRIIGVVMGNSPSSEIIVSDQRYADMNNTVSQIEDKISSMELLDYYK